MEEEIKRLMADILELDEGAIGADTEREAVESWDSFNHLNLCLAIEEAFSLTLSVPEMEAMTSFAAIVEIVGKSRG